jgi:hypothetical protein
MYRKKITGLLLLIAIIASYTGCSATRRSRTESADGAADAKGSYLYSDVYENNISNGGFFIAKARIEILIDGTSERFTASVRKDKGGKWLASIRSFAGIEVIRAYADTEQVVILDRLGRAATLLTWEEVGRDLGLSYDILPVLAGDLPELNILSRNRLRCSDYTNFPSRNLNMRLLADCSVLRALVIILTDNINGREITVTAGEFSSVGGVDYSSVIEVQEKRGLFHVKLSIDNLEVPWAGDVEFSIPSNYKRNR